MKVTQKPAPARKVPGGGAENKLWGGAVWDERNAGTRRPEFKSDLNSTAPRPCCGYSSCKWPRRVTWEKPGSCQRRRVWAQGQLGIGVLDRTRGPTGEVSCRVSTPRGPAEWLCPPRTVGKINQDHHQSVQAWVSHKVDSEY